MLSCLEDVQFKKLIDSFELVNYNAGERILRRGDAASSFFIILKGTVHCTADEQIVQTCNR